MSDIASLDLAAIGAMKPEELIHWAFSTYGNRCAQGSSFQLTDTVITDMAWRAVKSFRLFTVDTLRLHDETYQYMETLESRYGIKLERIRPDPDRLKKMLAQHGEFLFFDSKAKQEYCCQIRKVEPNEKMLAELDVWITGLAAYQSGSRSALDKASLIERDGRKILKLAPLADWDEERIRGYIRANSTPYDTLFNQGYPSTSCIICSTPIRPGENIRAGRWRWFNALENNEECGIHL